MWPDRQSEPEGEESPRSSSTGQERSPDGRCRGPPPRPPRRASARPAHAARSPTSTARAPAAPSLPGPLRAAQAGLPAPTSTPPQPRTSGRPPLIVPTIAAITVSTPTAQHVGGKIIWWPSSAVLVGNRLGHRTRVHRGGASCINERGSSLQFRVPVRKASPDGIAGARSTSVAVAWVAEDSAPRHLIIRLIIHTIRRDPSGSIWIDEASNVSSPDRSGADQIDTEHQATDLAVGGSNPSRRATITAAQRPCDGIAVSCQRARLRPSCTTLAGSPKVTPPARPVRAAVGPPLHWPLPCTRRRSRPTRPPRSLPDRAWRWSRLWPSTAPSPVGQGRHRRVPVVSARRLPSMLCQLPAVLGPERVDALADQARVRFRPAAYLHASRASSQVAMPPSATWISFVGGVSRRPPLVHAYDR